MTPLNIYLIPITYTRIKIKYDFNQEISAMIWLNLKITVPFISPVMRVPDNIFWNQYINKLKSN